ncbi:MAG: hypothetical protein WAL71_00045 [Terriglobales bacterium]|jgi:hypothetical protein
MINPVSNAQTNYDNQASQATAQQPKPQPQASHPQDTVSLKSTGDVDHDGDSR